MLMNKQLPSFLLPENRRDAMKRTPDDPEFDSNTLYIPKQDFKELSDGMKRYWEIKKNAMDQILLYRIGEWYAAFYDDLDVCARFFEMITIPHPRSYQLGFPLRLLNDNIYTLISNGYKVAICEQTETREQMEQRQAEEKKAQRQSE